MLGLKAQEGTPEKSKPKVATLTLEFHEDGDVGLRNVKGAIPSETQKHLIQLLGWLKEQGGGEIEGLSDQEGSFPHSQGAQHIDLSARNAFDAMNAEGKDDPASKERHETLEEIRSLHEQIKEAIDRSDTMALDRLVAAYAEKRKSFFGPIANPSSFAETMRPPEQKQMPPAPPIPESPKSPSSVSGSTTPSGEQSSSQESPPSSSAPSLSSSHSPSSSPGDSDSPSLAVKEPVSSSKENTSSPSASPSSTSSASPSLHSSTHPSPKSSSEEGTHSNALPSFEEIGQELSSLSPSSPSASPSTSPASSSPSSSASQEGAGKQHPLVQKQTKIPSSVIEEAMKIGKSLQREEAELSLEGYRLLQASFQGEIAFLAEKLRLAKGRTKGSLGGMKVTGLSHVAKEGGAPKAGHKYIYRWLKDGAWRYKYSDKPHPTRHGVGQPAVAAASEGTAHSIEVHPDLTHPSDGGMLAAHERIADPVDAYWSTIRAYNTGIYGTKADPAKTSWEEKDTDGNIIRFQQTQSRKFGLTIHGADSSASKETTPAKYAEHNRKVKTFFKNEEGEVVVSWTYFGVSTSIEYRGKVVAKRINSASNRERIVGCMMAYDKIASFPEKKGTLNPEAKKIEEPWLRLCSGGFEMEAKLHGESAYRLQPILSKSQASSLLQHPEITELIHRSIRKLQGSLRLGMNSEGRELMVMQGTLAVWEAINISVQDGRCRGFLPDPKKTPEENFQQMKAYLWVSLTALKGPLAQAMKEEAGTSASDYIPETMDMEEEEEDFLYEYEGELSEEEETEKGLALLLQRLKEKGIAEEEEMLAVIQKGWSLKKS